MLTDGIEESSAPDGTLFGLERTLQVVRTHQTRPARQIVRELYEAVRLFAGGSPQLDDITVIVGKCAG
jgi:serine phosphatase RsbU (regulator of sigma subunit)